MISVNNRLAISWGEQYIFDEIMMMSVLH